MKNILRIFKYDLMRIHKNVIAMIVIMGITVIPTLYAWFNIAASWDPYGNTGNLKVAVASSDEGYSGELLSVNLNLGDQVLTTLRGNSQLDWTFTSAKKAKEGVKSGKYYAAIVIPKDFSKDMMSIFTSNVTHPEIKYYINEKENAIAPKVTVKGANAVQQQINDTFVQTVSQTALEAFQLVNNVADETDDQTIADNLSAALAQISTDLSSAAGTVQAFSDMANSAAIMLNTTTEFLSQSGSGTKASVNALGVAGNGIDSLNSALTGQLEGENSHKYMVTTPKTKSSIRTIPIAETLLNDFKRLLEQDKKTYGFKKSWYVFGTDIPITNSQLRDRKNQLCQKANLKQIRIHDFRHSCASLLINNDANITMVAKYLGHTKINETLNTYSHMFKNKLNDIVNTINKLT